MSAESSTNTSSIQIFWLALMLLIAYPLTDTQVMSLILDAMSQHFFLTAFTSLLLVSYLHTGLCCCIAFEQHGSLVANLKWFFFWPIVYFKPEGFVIKQDVVLIDSEGSNFAITLNPQEFTAIRAAVFNDLTSLVGQFFLIKSLKTLLTAIPVAVFWLCVFVYAISGQQSVYDMLIHARLSSVELFLWCCFFVAALPVVVCSSSLLGKKSVFTLRRDSEVKARCHSHSPNQLNLA